MKTPKRRPIAEGDTLVDARFATVRDLWSSKGAKAMEEKP